MLLGTLAACLLGSAFKVQRVIRAGESTIRAYDKF